MPLDSSPPAPPDPSSVRYSGPWVHGDVRANGIRMHTVEYQPEGGETPPDRPLVLFLHGFLEFWWAWRSQLPAVHAAGYRAVAVDLRGYGDSDKPPRGYDGWTLAGDVSGLIRALGHRSAVLVGHADGGLICWATATLQPREVSAMALISSPHPIALKRSTLRDSAQRRGLLKRLTAFQLPRWPEAQLLKDDAAEVEQLITAQCGAQWPQTADFSDAMLKYRSAVAIPGTAHCSLEYQRWAWRSQFRPDGSRFMSRMNTKLAIPVLAMRGTEDSYVAQQPVHTSHNWADDYRIRDLEGVGHYGHEESPSAVTDHLVQFLTSQ